MGSCCPLPKTKFCPSMRAPGDLIPITVREFSTPSHIRSLNRRYTESWRGSGPTECCMAKEASKIMIEQRSSGL